MAARPQRSLASAPLALLLLLLPGVAPARVGVDEEEDGSAKGGGEEGGVVAGFDEKEGGFFVRSRDGDSKLVVGGRLQGRFDFVSFDDGIDEEDVATFALRRARLYLVGNVFGRENSFHVQLGADTRDAYLSSNREATDFRLLDGWLKREFSEAFALKVGQFKVPFSRQGLTSSGKLQLPTRSIVLDLSTLDLRDVGLEASGGFAERQLLYALAVTNGAGPNRLNLDDRLAVFGRLAWNPSGDYGYSEGDVERSESLASTLGIAATYRETDDARISRANLDLGLKRRGLSLQAEVGVAHHDPDAGEETTDVAGYVQAGCFLRPHRLEVAGRASRISFDDDAGDVSEYVLGLNSYWFAHRLKAQAAYTLYDYENADQRDHRVIAEAQLWF